MADFERVQEYGKIRAGEQVRVKGERGTFVVKYIDEFLNKKRQAEITVIGGTGGHVAWRTFLADKVKPEPKRRARKTKDDD
jgi:hypothetical protein